jgi:hypothetical protein
MVEGQYKFPERLYEQALRQVGQSVAARMLE